MLAEGDKVATGKNFRGSHTGEFVGMPPTGNAIAVDWPSQRSRRSPGEGVDRAGGLGFSFSARGPWSERPEIIRS